MARPAMIAVLVRPITFPGPARVLLQTSEAPSGAALLRVLGRFPALIGLLLLVAWGDTKKVLTPTNLDKSRQLTEAFDTQAHVCERDEERETA